MTDTSANTDLASLSMEVDWASKGQGIGFMDTGAATRHVALFKVAGKRRSEAEELLKHAADGTPLHPDYVHDLRVGLRRLSEVAGLLTVLMDKGSGRAVAESLKALRQSAGALRDLDVAAEHLTKWRMPSSLKKCARIIVEKQAATRGELEQSLRTAATSASIGGTMVLLARVLEEQAKPEYITTAGTKLHRELEKRIVQRRKKLKRSFGKAAQKQKAELLHEARIAAKKLRYVVELQKELDEKGSRKDLRFLKTIQKLLGDHHDVHVIEETMEREISAKRSVAPKGLGMAWRKWRREVEHAQAKRAAEFFMRTYAWMNAGA